MYYTYMIRCEDNSIYTGYTSDLKRRLEEHIKQSEKGAKYTKSHAAKKLEAAWQTEDRKIACKLEYAIKTLNKKDKEKLIVEETNIENLFKEKFEEFDLPKKIK